MKWFIWLAIGILVLFILGRLAHIKKRGYFWKTKQGEQLSLKGFFKKWGEGIDGVTPKQQAWTQMICMYPVFAGIVWGIVTVTMAKTYWMTLVLAGSLPLSIIQFIASLQKYRRHKLIENTMKSIQVPQETKEVQNE